MCAHGEPCQNPDTVKLIRPTPASSLNSHLPSKVAGLAAAVPWLHNPVGAVVCRVVVAYPAVVL